MGRRPHHGTAFVWIVAATWIVGLFGLERGRISSLHLPMVAMGGFIVYMVMAAIRHHLVARQAEIPDLAPDPNTCVKIKQLGEARERLSSTVKVIAQEPAATRAELELVIEDDRADPHAFPVRRVSRRRPGRIDYIPITGA